jgi:hypothetical protein
VPRSMQLHKKRNAASTPGCQAGVLVVCRHRLVVRCSLGERRYAFGRASIACPT